MGKMRLLKFCRAFFYFSIFCAFLIVCLFIGGRFYVAGASTQKAQVALKSVLKDQNKVMTDEDIIALTLYVFTHFERGDPSLNLALRLRPFVTNPRLPSALRYPEGGIEILNGYGLCDNASRMLAFLLKQKGIDSVQWNIVSNDDAHSALLVYMPDGRNVFVDPYFGYVAYDRRTQKLISAEEAKTRLLAGASLDDVFLSLTDDGHPKFYKSFAGSSMAAQGHALRLTADIPLLKDGKSLVLGAINDSDEDVKHESGVYGMTPYWHYVGHKYNREWVRVLQAHENIRLEMVLVQNAENSVLTSDVPPGIRGRSLIWDLTAGDKIVFQDGLAKISWSRMNSFIGVDQIKVTLR